MSLMEQAQHNTLSPQVFVILIQPSAHGSSPHITDSPSVSEFPVSNTITSVPLVRYGRETTARGTYRHRQ